MRGRLLIVPALAIGVAAGLTTSGGVAAAPGDADTTVTIKAEGLDLSGLVKSPRPNKCADGRKVVVFKQKGTRGGGDDEPFAHDTASLVGMGSNVAKWSTGNTGVSGRVYARVRHIDGCKGDTSPTIRATPNP